MGHRDALSLRYTRPPPGIFCKSYECHSMACLDRPGLEFGDKIIMPQTAFREAHALRLKLPLLFKLVNATESRRGIAGTASSAPCQFCGVLEFSAPDDQVFLPYWLMQNLLVSEGARVELRSLLRPPSGSFVRFEPHDPNFLAVAARQGPKVLMEEALRRYSVLSEGATILVQHEGENFFLDVVELRTLAFNPKETFSDVRNTGGDRVSSGFPLDISCLARVGQDGKKRGHDEARGCSDEGISNGAANGDSDGENNRACQPLSGGRRVKLVSLLGDLDLEVEFSQAHSAPTASASAPRQYDATEEQHADHRHRKDRRHLAKVVPESEQKDDDVGRDLAVSRGNPLYGARLSTVDSMPGGTLAPSSTTSPVFAGPPSCRHASNNPTSGSNDPLVTERDNKRRGGSETTMPLPAPARARNSCEDRPSSAVFGSGPEPMRSRAGIQGYRPPVPPMWRASSKTSKCRAFSGKGMSLVGRTPVLDPAIGGVAGALVERNGVATESVCLNGQNIPRKPATARAAAPAIPTASPTAHNDTIQADFAACDDIDVTLARPAGAWSCGERLSGRTEQIANVRGSSIGGPRLSRVKDGTSTDEIPTSPGRKCNEGVVTGETLDECTPGAGSSAAAASMVGLGAKTLTADRTAVPKDHCLREKVAYTTRIDETTETSAEKALCGSCGKLVPAANRLLHELRCSSSPILRPGRRRSPTPCRPSAVVDHKHQSSLRTHSPSHQAPAKERLRARWARSPVGTTGAAVANREHTKTATTTAPTAASTVASTPESVVVLCMYCGLSFRTASVAGEHEVACAARTERCVRCCGLVSRGEIESHRRPGGGCDAAITTAQAAEARFVADVDVSGRGRGGTRMSEANGGRFDALLAEAVRSSKAASAVLADAREKNHARMTKEASDRLEGPSVGPHVGRECADVGKGDCGGLFGVAVRNNGRKNASESNVEQLQLPTPHYGAASSESRVRGYRPSQAGDGGASTDLHDRGAAFDVPRAEKRTSGGGPILLSRLVKQTATCAGSIQSDQSDPRNGAPPSAVATEEQGDNTRPEREEELGREAKKAAIILALEGSPWTCPRCTLNNPRETEVCDACEWTRKSAVNHLECNRVSTEHTSSSSEHEIPGPTVASLEDREGRGLDQRAARTRTEGVELGNDGLMPARAVTAVKAGGGGISTRVLRQPSTNFIPAELRTPSATADDGSPRPSGGTVSSIVAAVSRNTGERAGALPALVAVARGGFSRDGRGLTSGRSMPADESDAEGAADDSPRVHGQGLHRPSPRGRTPTLRAVSAAHRQQQRQQNTTTMNLARRETGRRRRESGTRRREGRRAPPTTAISVGPPRRLGGVHRSRRLRYPASSSLTPPEEQPYFARSGIAAAWTKPRAPPTSSSPASIAAAGRAQEAAADRNRPLIRHHEDALRLSSSSAPSARCSVQRGVYGISSGTSSSKRDRLKSGDGNQSGSGGVDGCHGGGDSGASPGLILPQAVPQPSSAAPVCDMSLSILGRSQPPGTRVGRAEVSEGNGEGSCLVRPRHGIKLAALQRWREGRRRDVGGGGSGGGSGGSGTRAWERHDGPDSRVGPGVGVKPLRVRRRVSDARLLEPLIAI